MKQQLIARLMTAALALAPVSVGLCQCPPANPYFTNSTTYVIPGNNGNINAGNFANTKSGQFAYAGSPFLFFPYNTTNFFNWGTMSGFPGFDFETWLSCSGYASMAANFVNQPQGLNSGVISCSGYLLVSNVSGLQGAIYSGLMGSSKLIVSAKNITNSGTIYMDASGLIALTGNNVNLSYGGVTMSTPYSSAIFGTNVGLAFTAPVFWMVIGTRRMRPAGLRAGAGQPDERDDAVVPGDASDLHALQRYHLVVGAGRLRRGYGHSELEPVCAGGVTCTIGARVLTARSISLPIKLPCNGNM